MNIEYTPHRTVSTPKCEYPLVSYYDFQDEYTSYGSVLIPKSKSSAFIWLLKLRNKLQSYW